MNAEGAKIIPFPTRRREDLLTLAEVREEFGFSERWWRYRIKEGLPRHRWGGQWRFRASEIEEWMKEHYGKAS